MPRAFILVMDSVGIGGAPDAAAFGDAGSDTIGHIDQACSAGRGDNEHRSGPLRLPNLARLGLGRAAAASGGITAKGLGHDGAPEGGYGYAVEKSRGKDTPSGHWELAGVPVEFDWGYFPRTVPSFPPDLTDALISKAGLPGILGDCHASGTEIIAQLGLEHIESGKPICYTSADSVFQIAAHEEHFGLERLYDVCQIARELVDPLTIGRVIARPFTGSSPETFERTGNRRDLAVPPPAPTLLNKVEDVGGSVISIGKIGDIYAHSGTGEIIKANGNDALFDETLAACDRATDGALVLTNFVDFDQLYGHRRDIAGYAAALEAFDRRLPEFEAAMRPGDLAVISADHGCDPTAPGTDHTRENVPVIAFGPAAPTGDLGQRESFADIGQSIADHLGLAPLQHGTSFI